LKAAFDEEKESDFENIPRCSMGAGIGIGIGIGAAIAVEKSRPGLLLRDDTDADPEKASGTEKRLKEDFHPRGRNKWCYERLDIDTDVGSFIR